MCVPNPSRLAEELPSEGRFSFFFLSLNLVAVDARRAAHMPAPRAYSGSARATAFALAVPFCQLFAHLQPAPLSDERWRAASEAQGCAVRANPLEKRDE